LIKGFEQPPDMYYKKSEKNKRYKLEGSKRQTKKETARDASPRVKLRVNPRKE